MKDIVAIYSRLSEEDKNKQHEYDDSQSIQNQKKHVDQLCDKSGVGNLQYLFR